MSEVNSATQVGEAPSSRRNVMILLAYLWPLAVVPLLIERRDREVQWHARHGLLLTALEVIFWIAVQVTAVALGSFLGCLLMLFVPVFLLAIVVVRIFAVVMGINGQRLTIPLISRYVDRF